MPASRTLSLFLLGILSSILLAALYGVLNDQITVTLSPEYFSVFKRAQFREPLRAAHLENAPPRSQAVIVGIAATWWFGLLLGLILSLFALVGSQPPLTAGKFFAAVVGVLLVTLLTSLLSGAIAWFVAPHLYLNGYDWPFLRGIRDTRAAFAVGWWHNGAYLGAVLGTLRACFHATNLRRHTLMQ